MADTVRFTIDNSLITDALGKIDKSTLKDFDAQIKYITNALKSATNNIVAVTKQLDPASGLYKATFSVDKTQSSNARETMLSATASLSERYGYEPDFVHTIKEENEKTLEFYRTLKGNRAKQLADSSIGSEAFIEPAPTHKNKDRYKISYRISEDEYQTVTTNLGSESKAKTFYSKELSSKMSKALSASAFESKEEALKAQEKEEAKKEKERERAERRREREKSKDENKKKEDRDKQEKKKGFMPAHWIQVVVAVLVTIADIARRILTATLDRAVKVKEQAVEARSLSVTQNDIRRFESQERAMGLRKGVFTGALSDIQSNLGDISNLNEKTLAELAKVLGSDVKQMVDIALGENNPAKAMELILNSYYKRGQQGINSVGMQVGQAQAERELATALEKAGMNNLAEILRSMFYNNAQGVYAGRIGTDNPFQDYMELTSHDYGSTSIDVAMVSMFGQEVEALKDKFSRLGATLTESFLLKIGKFVDAINDWTIGQTSSQKADTVTEHAEHNKRAMKSMEDKASVASQSYASIFKNAGVDFSDAGFKDLGITDATSFMEWLVGASLNNNLPITGDTSFEAYQKAMNFLLTPEGQTARVLFAIEKSAKGLAEQAESDWNKNMKGKTGYSETSYTNANLQYLIQSGYFDAISSDWSQSQHDIAYVEQALFRYQELYGKDYALGYTGAELRELLKDFNNRAGVDSKYLLSQKHNKLDEAVARKLGYSKSKNATKRALEARDITEEALLSIAISGLGTEYEAGWGFDKNLFELMRKKLQRDWAERTSMEAGLVLATMQAVNSEDVRNALANNTGATFSFAPTGEGIFTLVIKSDTGKTILTKEMSTNAQVDFGQAVVDSNGNIENVTSTGRSNQSAF